MHDQTRRSEALSEVAPGGARGARSTTSWGDLGAAIDAGWASLRHHMTEHPARTVAMAVGAGYLLGGGLFSRLTGRILGTGARLAFRLVAVPLAVEAGVAAAASVLASRDRSQNAASADPSIAPVAPPDVTPRL